MGSREFKEKLIKFVTMFIFSKKHRRSARQKMYSKLKVSNYEYNRQRYNIGEFSYLGKHSTISNAKESTVGKYCSISHWVKIGLSQHPIDTLTTHGFIVNKKGNCPQIDNLISVSEENRVRFEEKLKPPVHIGNDVWIGYRAIIMDGVTVGNGAVVAAGAIVTKDVEPYSIVAGVPAKPIGMRFADISDNGKLYEKLQEIRWWDFPPEVVCKLPFEDVYKCIEILEDNIHLRQN